MIWAWVVAGLVLLAVEAHTTAFYSMFFALGCLGGAAAAAAGLDTLPQVAIAGVLAVAGAGLARPPLARYMQRRNPTRAFPGVASLQGQTGITADTVGDEHHPGHVVLAGDRWLAVTDGPDTLEPDRDVVVVSVKGTTLLVRPIVAR